MKYCSYHIKLNGDKGIVDFLNGFIPGNQDCLSRSREIKKAVETIFGDRVSVNISVMVARPFNTIVRTVGK